MTLSYDGTRYHGWQLQEGHITIQEVIEKALLSIIQERVRVIGSGRTDTGVHAAAQVAHFRTQTRLEAHRLLMAMNSRLPQDIRILKVEDADAKFHARFSVRWKKYRYSIWTGEVMSVLDHHWLLHHPHSLDVALMKKAAEFLIGCRDFSSFSVNVRDEEGRKKNAVRTMRKIKILKKGPLITIQLEADGFLYRMVRSIVGTLIKVGEKKMSIGDFKKVINKKNRAFAGQTVLPQGLCLMKVTYS